MKWITMILYALEIIYLNVLALSLNSIVLLENKLRLVAKGIFQTPGNPLKKLYKTIDNFLIIDYVPIYPKI